MCGNSVLLSPYTRYGFRCSYMKCNTMCRLLPCVNLNERIFNFVFISCGKVPWLTGRKIIFKQNTENGSTIVRWTTGMGCFTSKIVKNVCNRQYNFTKLMCLRCTGWGETIDFYSIDNQMQQIIHLFALWWLEIYTFIRQNHKMCIMALKPQTRTAR